MKLKVTQENLARALNRVARVASGKNTLPILSNLLFKTSGTRLSIAATNLDIAITCYVGSKIKDQGSITIPARLTQEFISSLPREEVIELELEDTKLHITTTKYQSTINGINAEEFPVMPLIKTGKTINIPTQKLKKGLQQAIIAAGNDEARPTLTGVYIHSHEGQLYVVATDGYRLAEKNIVKTDKDISLLVPATAIQDLLRVIPENEDDNIEVVYDDQQVLFRLSNVELVARLIEGKYPDYRKLIPKDFSTITKLNKEDFTNIVKVSSLFAKENAGSITLSAEESKGILSIQSVASQLGENTATSSAEVKGDGDININSRYLIDALGVIGGEEIEFCFNGKLDACVLKEAKNNNYIHVIMPLKS